MKPLIKKVFDRLIYDLDIKRQAKDLGLPFWQAPSFLFALMGVVIIFIMTIVYVISQQYESPELIIISEVVVVIVLLTIGNFIIQSVEQVAKINKMKSEFVSIASHQLKAPLAEINWEIELLLAKNKEGLSENQLKLIERIAKSNQHMARLVNDLLDVARIESGNFFLLREDFDLAELVAKIVENNLVLTKAHNVEIKYYEPSTPVIVHADKKRIGVAIDNLLSNALKYIKHKGLVEVSVKCEQGKAIVAVKDNGIGIPANQQDFVFQKFFRSENAYRYQVSGTGLGLFIAKNIVENSGGKIWFKSKENVGSEFCFSLPLVQKV